MGTASVLGGNSILLTENFTEQLIGKSIYEFHKL